MTDRFQRLRPGDPAEVGGYELKARLGAGGMGSVYLSFTRGGIPLAVKVMKQELADDPGFRRRFKKEVDCARLVHGRYTAQVLDAGPDAPLPWLATAYIGGPSLKQAVGEHGPLPLFSVFRLLAGTAEGIDDVHEVGLIHRDLTPANVILAPDGPRVIDFGIAHAADASSLTSAGQVIGTPAFMAPEQISGHPVTEATDVWALGHLAVYAAAGRAAFGEGIPSVLIHRVLHDEPQLEDCPEPLRGFAQKCLAKDPADRPSVREVLDFASEALRGQTMRLVSESWLPTPILDSLQGYDTSSLSVPPGPPPAPPRLVPRSAPAGMKTVTASMPPASRSQDFPVLSCVTACAPILILALEGLRVVTSMWPIALSLLIGIPASAIMILGRRSTPWVIALSWNCLLITIFNLCDLLFAHEVIIHETGSLGKTVFSLCAIMNLMMTVIMFALAFSAGSSDSDSNERGLVGIFSVFLAVGFPFMMASAANRANATGDAQAASTILLFALAILTFRIMYEIITRVLGQERPPPSLARLP